MFLKKKKKIYTVTISQTPEAQILVLAKDDKEALKTGLDIWNTKSERFLSIPTLTKMDVYPGRLSYFTNIKEVEENNPLDEDNCPF